MMAVTEQKFYEYNEETDKYHFEGKIHESDCDILETLLDRKIKSHQ